MADTAIELFAEDRAMQDILSALVLRIAREAGLTVRIAARCAGGGHSRALDELRAFQLAVREGQPGISRGVLVVGRDANCVGHQAALRSVQERLDPAMFLGTAIACPDPHIERWLMADPETFCQVVGVDPRPGRRKCERSAYKALLAQAIIRGGHPPTLNGIEFASELVGAMNLYRAGKNEPSLGHFIEQLKAVFGQLT